MHRSTPVHYVTVAAARGTITRTVTATGTVNPVLTIIVGTYVSGVIQNLYCDYNTQVRAGQVCAKIDPRPYQATLDQYSGQLLRDQAVLDKDRIDLARYQQLADAELDRAPAGRGPSLYRQPGRRRPSSSTRRWSKAPSSISTTPTSSRPWTAPSCPAT